MDKQVIQKIREDIGYVIKGLDGTFEDQKNGSKPFVYTRKKDRVEWKNRLVKAKDALADMLF